MARQIKKDDHEHGATHAQHEHHGTSLQLNNTRLASLPEPHKPSWSHPTIEENTAPTPHPPPSIRIRWRTPIVMVVICSGGLITSLDAVIMGTALPSIASDLGATTTELAWVGASYLLSSAVLQPMWPTLSELTSRKLAFALGFVLFAAGSLIAALARRADILIAGRTVQGLGAGNISSFAMSSFPTSSRCGSADSISASTLLPVARVQRSVLSWAAC